MEHSKYKETVDFSSLTNYHYQNNSIYVKINCPELLEGRK